MIALILDYIDVSYDETNLYGSRYAAWTYLHFIPYVTVDRSPHISIILQAQHFPRAGNPIFAAIGEDRSSNGVDRSLHLLLEIIVGQSSNLPFLKMDDG